MAYERTRQKLGLGPEVPDEEVLRQGYTRARAKRPAMTAEEYRTRLSAYEGAGAPTTLQATPPPQAGQPAGRRAAPAPNLLQRAGGFVRDAAVEIGKDAQGLAMGLTVDPVAQMGRAIQQRRLIVEPTPEEAERAKRGLAFLGGGVAGGIGGMVAKKAVGGLGSRALRMMLEGSGAGATGGGADAAIRSGGDPRQTAAGVALGAGLGGAAGGVASRLKRAPVAAVADEVAPPPSSLPTGKAVPLAGVRGVNNPALPISTRIAAQGPEGESLRAMLLKADDEGMVGAGKALDDLEQAGLFSLSTEDDRMASLARRGLVPRESLSPAAARALETVDRYLGGVPERGNVAGLRVKTKAGVSRPIPTNPRYHPEDLPPASALKASRIGLPKPVRKSVLRDLLDTGRFTEKAQAEHYLDDFNRFRDSRGRRGGDIVARKMVDEGQATSIEEARGMLARHVSRSRVDRSSNLERAREVRLGIFDPSLKRRIPGYAEETEKRIAEATVFGPEFENMDRVLGAIPDEEEREVVAHLVKVAREAGDTPDRALENLLRLGRRSSMFLLSPVTTAKNIGQVGNVLMRTDPGSTLRGLIKSFTPAGHRRALRSGSITPSAMRQSSHGVTDTGSLVDAYMRGIGFSKSEKWLRKVAENSAEFYAAKHAKRAAKGRASSMEELRKLRLDPEDIAKRGGALTDDELLKAGKIVTDETQFRARAMDLPSAMSEHPLTKNMGQFKSFIFQQTELLKRETVNRLLSGKPGDRARGIRNLAILGTVYPMTGEAVNNLVSLITGKERDTEGLTRYLENLMTPGGAGIAADIFGAVERGNLPEWVAGPTVGRWGKNAAIGLKAGKRLVKGEDDLLTEGEKRTLLRQVPAVGPAVANRAFPPKEKKKAGTRPERPTTRPERKERPQ